jgi:hypothetical protein
MHFQMQEESQESPQIEVESDSESQRDTAPADETTQDVTQQDAPLPPRNKKKKRKHIPPLQEVESSMRSATSFLMLTEDVTSHKNNMLNKLNRLLWCQNVNTPLFQIHLPHP